MNEYRNMTSEELLAAYDESGMYVPERDAEICRKAGLESEWEESDGDAFESVLLKAVEILREG